jgi:hypothetical protein
LNPGDLASILSRVFNTILSTFNPGGTFDSGGGTVVTFLTHH